MAQTGWLFSYLDGLTIFTLRAMCIQAAHLHVVAEGLLVLASGSESVSRLDRELRRENVGKLGAVAVAASRSLLLVVVVVATGKHCTV